MRASWLVLCCWLALSPVAGRAQPLTSPTYDELLAHARRGDPDVDFLALRYAYAGDRSYEPYDVEGTAVKAFMRTAYAAGDCATASGHAATILDKNYIDIDAHIIADLCGRRAGDQEHAKRHEVMARGLLRSIFASGDGKSPETAWVVISIQEEYTVLSVLGLQKRRQARVDVGDHAYDRMDVVKDGGGTEAVFFNIDRPLAWLHRQNRGR